MRLVHRSAPCLSVLLVAAAAFGIAPPVRGEISPELQREAAGLAQGDRLPVILELEARLDIRALDRALKLGGASRAERHQRVVESLQDIARRTQAPVLETLMELHARGQVDAVRPFWIGNLITLDASRAAIVALATRPEIARVLLQPVVHGFEPLGRGPARAPGDGGARSAVPPGLAAIRASEVWHDLGVTGQGALVASLDSGVDGTHPALEARWRGNNGHSWEACWLDVQDTHTTYPADSREHGTHTMGTMTGLDPATSDTIGVAWGAHWIAANGVGELPWDLVPDILACFEWFADPDGDPATIDDVPDVVNNSWGVSALNGFEPCADVWNQVVDNCEAAGIVLIFAAGNRGPDPASLDSPADRALNSYNAFSVGAVDATNSPWPYPVAEFSSRGPTPCADFPEFEIKPEVCAPGVRVYSSIPGGEYMEADGTSMAGPHVAGVVALMRSVNPDIEVDAIKQVLMDTARDEGPAGEDNDYGWGFIDAYEAVLQCLGGGFGTCTGQVTNNDGGGSPVPFARVALPPTGNAFTADADGFYWGLLQAGTHTLEVSHPSFATETRPGVVIEADGLTVEDFSLEDIAAPVLSDVVQPTWFEDPQDPIRIRVTLSDFSPLVEKELLWRVDGGGWSAAPLSVWMDERHEGFIPGQPIGSVVHYYLRALDAAGNEGLEPAGAPAEYRTVNVLETWFADDAETDKGWTLFLEGDATNGRWVRHDPWGTWLRGEQVEPSDDHTPDEGVNCFVTGAGFEGAEPDQSDVDNGCVNLTSPIFDLQDADTPILTYWRWFALQGLFQDGSFTAKVSNNGGQSWSVLEQLTSNANSWERVVVDLATVLPLTAQMQLRFTACDDGSPSLLEAAIDDLSLVAESPVSSVDEEAPLDSGPAITLEAIVPNPFRDGTTLAFHLAKAGVVELTIHDITGRKVETLASGPFSAGRHALDWTGQRDDGRRAPAGVYFCRLTYEGLERSRKLLIVQ